MAQEVLLTISTLTGDDDEAMETKVTATYYQRADAHYLLFEENLEGYSTPFQSRLKIKRKHVELKRQGAADINMIFEEGQKHLTRYVTPYGELFLDIITRTVNVEEHPDGLSIKVQYTIENAGAPVSDYELHITVKE